MNGSREGGMNQRKHGVDFATAVGVFDDDRAMTIRDFDSSAKIDSLVSG
jgi:uncharacterized DUF497 family protein